MQRLGSLLCGATLLLVAGAVAAQSQPVALRGATLYPVSGAPIADGLLVFQAGRILSVGPAEQVRPPEGARIIDVTGSVIIPGLVDTHSHVGIYPRPLVPAHRDGNETSNHTPLSLLPVMSNQNRFDNV